MICFANIWMTKSRWCHWSKEVPTLLWRRWVKLQNLEKVRTLWSKRSCFFKQLKFDPLQQIMLCRIYGEFTMESILAAAFGRVINIQRGEADEVTEAAKGVFAAGRNKKIQISVALVSKLIKTLYIIHKIQWPYFYYIALFPNLTRPVQYYLSRQTKLMEPFKVLYHTALTLIGARRTGVVKQAKVSYYYMLSTYAYF